MASEHAPWLVRSTSPLHFCLTFVVAALLQAALGLPMPTGAALDTMHIVGTVLANTGLALALWCIALFALRSTTIMPAQMPARLIVCGPYRWTRNPFYLSLLLSYAGLAMILDVPWALALMPIPLAILRKAIIPFEEACLEMRFGADYADYRASVPRWF